MTRRSQQYPPELRERAVRMVAEIAGDYDSPWPAMRGRGEAGVSGRSRRSASGSAKPKSTPATALGRRPRSPEELKPLRREGECAQAKTLRAAASADNGRVSREQVFGFLGRPVDGRLNGFRKPLDRAVAALVAEGDFPAVTPGPLYVDYGGGVTAEPFWVKPADLPSLRAALGS